MEAGDAGRIAGTFVGLISGAQVGSAIPIPVVGTFVGAVAGGMLGSEAGRFVAKTVVSLAASLVQGLSKVAGSTAGALRSVAEEPALQP